MTEPNSNRPVDDSDTTVAQLRRMVAEFVDARDWHQFHAPKNISMALSIEAAELMEHFQWIDGPASRSIVQDPEKLSDVGEELADVFCYGLALANELGLDIATAIREKMIKNEEKYPVDEFRGRYGPEDQ